MKAKIITGVILSLGISSSIVGCSSSNTNPTTSTKPTTTETHETVTVSQVETDSLGNNYNEYEFHGVKYSIPVDWKENKENNFSSYNKAGSLDVITLNYYPMDWSKYSHISKEEAFKLIAKELGTDIENTIISEEKINLNRTPEEEAYKLVYEAKDKLTNSINYYYINEILFVKDGICVMTSQNPSSEQEKYQAVDDYIFNSLCIENNAKLPTDTFAASTGTENKSTIPQEVDTIYNKIKKIIEEKGLKYNVGMIVDETSNENGFNFKYYKFKISDSLVRFWYNDGKFQEYSITLPNDLKNAEKKELIQMAIAVSEDINYEEAAESMQKLANEFNGSSNTETLKLDKYRYYINASTNIIQDDSLIITPITTKEINHEEYKDVDPAYMQASLNEGEKVKITGKIINDLTFNDENVLEIENSDGKFVVYYSPESFGGDFNIGNQYTFYGRITALWKGYQGCIRLEYFE